MVSHPLRVRGLKLILFFAYPYRKESHPLRVRGLKQLFQVMNIKERESHPLRVRGLKLKQAADEMKESSRILYGCVD